MSDYNDLLTMMSEEELSDKDLAAMVIANDDEFDNEIQELRYLSDVSKAIRTIDGDENFKKYTEKGFEKINASLEKFGVIDEKVTMKNLDVYEECIKKEYDIAMGKNNSFGVNLNAKPKLPDLDKVADKEANKDKIAEKDTFNKLMTEMDEPENISKKATISQMNSKMRAEIKVQNNFDKMANEISEAKEEWPKTPEEKSNDNFNNFIKDQDMIKKQNERMKKLKEKGMYNDFEDGVSGDSGYDFEEPEI